jgi:hypothetical protein
MSYINNLFFIFVIKNIYDTIGSIRQIQVFTVGSYRLGKGPRIRTEYDSAQFCHNELLAISPSPTEKGVAI